MNALNCFNFKENQCGPQSEVNFIANAPVGNEFNGKIFRKTDENE